MMQHHLWLLPVSMITIACNPAGDAPGGSGSSSSTTVAPTTTDTPTSDAPTTGMTGTTGTTGTTSTGEGTTTGAVDTTGSTGSAPSPGCGDGVVDPDEQCDPGIDQLSQTGACTLTCEAAKCGDNLVWAGNEDCDNGPSNNDDLYGGCTNMCTFGPRCNDGEVQGPEECDLGVEDGEFPPDGVPCAGCRFQARLAFLSSATYKGGDLGGVEGAHIKCQNLAKLAKFDNALNFMAWISDAQHSPFQDFNNNGPETAGLPYVRPDGVRIADDWDALVSGGPIEGIIVTEMGETLLSKLVWTGTAPSGKVLDPTAHCQSWTSSSSGDKSRVGRSGLDKVLFPQAWAQWVAEREWTNFATLSCDKANRLYCVEQ